MVQNTELLLEAGLLLSAERSSPAVLQRVVDLAVQLTDCRYGALGVIGPDGVLTEFVTTGLSDEERRSIEHSPQGRGILGAVMAGAGALRLADIGADARSVGFPPHHPPMRSFLGVPLRAHGEVLGSIYLGEKHGAPEFSADDEAALVTLAAQAAVAIVNARLYADLDARERWLEALRAINAEIIAGSPTADVLRSVAENARALVGGDLATIHAPRFPSGTLEVVAAVGAYAERLAGFRVPREGSLTGEVLRSGEAVMTDDAASDPRIFQPMVRSGPIGPAIFVPLTASAAVFGALGVARLPGGPSFHREDLQMIQSFADQAAVALEYGRSQRDKRRLAVLEERDRIARELHDGAIQEIYAAGLSLRFLAEAPDRRSAQALNGIADDLDVVINDLRSYIRGLHPPLLTGHDLTQSLRQIALELEAATGISVVVDIDLSAATEAGPFAPDIVQVVREALSNVRRHANAQTCRVALQQVGDSLRLEVDDDGRGLDPDAETKGGNGLRNMRERAISLGGSFDIHSSPGEGTRIVILLPLDGVVPADVEDD